MSLLEILRPIVDALEAQLATAIVAARQAVALDLRVQAIEARMDRVTAFVESGGKGGDVRGRTFAAMSDLPDPAAIAAAIVAASARAERYGHALGPWTRPPTVDRPAFAMCRQCDALAEVTIQAAIVVPDRRCGSSALAKAVLPPAPVKIVENPRTYEPKACATCGRDFQPSGPRSSFCRQPDCVAPTTRAASRPARARA